MSGILDPKSRILDTIVTLEGRRQISNAKLKIEYLSFTDANSFYEEDLLSGSTDASSRLSFEQTHLPQDQITFEADDSGRVKAFKNSENITIKDGHIIEYSFNALTSSVLSGTTENIRILSGDEFASTAGNLIASSIDNFAKLRMIGTKDTIFEDDGFSISNKSINFTIHNDRPLSDKTTHTAYVDQLESLFQDVRLSKVKNFQYLPPVNRIDDEKVNKKDYRKTKKYHLGKYPPFGRTHLHGLTGRQIERELKYYEKLGYSKTVQFEPTSMKNNILTQFFEINHNVMKKLDVIDFGTYTWKGNIKHAFFVGKIVIDNNDTHTFIHLFTLVFG